MGRGVPSRSKSPKPLRSRKRTCIGILIVWLVCLSLSVTRRENAARFEKAQVDRAIDLSRIGRSHNHPAVRRKCGAAP